MPNRIQSYWDGILEDMRTTRQFNVTLPLDMADAVERKVKSGAYASVSAVVRDGVRALLERDAAVERWIREEVVPGHQEYLADPTKACRPTRCLNASSRGAAHANPSDLSWRLSSRRSLNATLTLSAQYIITHASEAKLNRPDAGRRSNADPVAIVEFLMACYTPVWVTGGGGITIL